MLRKLNDTLSDVSVRYGHILQVICDWVDATVMVMVCGRGTAKSTVIQARRIFRCVMDMPGAPLAIVANTYSNLDNNIMPAVYKGWQLMGWIDGVHYIKGKRPAESWRRRCSIIVDEYEHVISFWNGSVLFLGSLDNPSLLAGSRCVTCSLMKRNTQRRPRLTGHCLSFEGMLSPTVIATCSWG